MPYVTMLCGVNGRKTSSPKSHRRPLFAHSMEIGYNKQQSTFRPTYNQPLLRVILTT